jgi:diketogulonate reductase-like aldo/keto reductase
MPSVGLGVRQTPRGHPRRRSGRPRHWVPAIDTASPYGNERQVGEGVHSADIEYGGHASDGGRTTATTDGELDRSKR